MTSPRGITLLSPSANGSSRRAFSTAIFTRYWALRVAFSGSFMCTQEQCSLMLAISKRYLFTPAERRVSRNNG
jgi:hypothetical protein